MIFLHFCFHPSTWAAEFFCANCVSIMSFDALAPYVPRSSAAIMKICWKARGLPQYIKMPSYDLTSMSIPIKKLRWSYDHLIFIMGTPYLEEGLYNEMEPNFLVFIGNKFQQSVCTIVMLREDIKCRPIFLFHRNDTSCNTLTFQAGCSRIRWYSIRSNDTSCNTLTFQAGCRRTRWYSIRSNDTSCNTLTFQAGCSRTRWYSIRSNDTSCNTLTFQAGCRRTRWYSIRSNDTSCNTLTFQAGCSRTRWYSIRSQRHWWDQEEECQCACTFAHQSNSATYAHHLLWYQSRA